MNRRETLIWTRHLNVIFIVVGCCLFGGCRLHDAGRLEISNNAVELAAAVHDSNSGPFHAMSVNLQTVDASYDRMVDMQADLRKASFFGGLDNLDREDILDELNAAVDLHLEIKSRIDSYIRQATARLKGLSAVGTNLIDTTNPTTILKTIDQLYAGLRQAIANIATMLDSNGDFDTEERKSTVAELADKLDEIISAAANDRRVESVSRLELEAARAAASARQRQLDEVRRHLQELLLIQRHFDQRHRDFLDQLALVAMSQVDTESFTQRYVEHNGNPPIQQMLDQSANWVSLWGDQNLAGYLDSALQQYSADAAKSESAVQLPIVLGIILFVEIPADQRADVTAATAVHHHSIRLSELNARYRLQIVHELTSALNMYYEGGIKPEEVARLALAAGQVGALVGIAASE